MYPINPGYEFINEFGNGTNEPNPHGCSPLPLSTRYRLDFSNTQSIRPQQPYLLLQRVALQQEPQNGNHVLSDEESGPEVSLKRDLIRSVQKPCSSISLQYVMPKRFNF
jgi:hypothetical protein